MKLSETSWLHVFWGKGRTCFFSLFFFTSLIAPWWTLAFLIFLPPLQNFMLFLQQKMSPFFFLSLQLFFSLSFAGLSPYFLFFSVFLFLYIPNFFGMTINLSLYFRQHGRIQKHFPLSVFVFIDSLVVFASQDAGVLPRQTDYLTFINNYHRLTCSGCTDGGRSGVMGRAIRPGHGFPICLTYGAPLRARERAPLIKGSNRSRPDHSFKLMLHETIRNDDFQRNTALQHCCDIVSNG